MEQRKNLSPNSDDGFSILFFKVKPTLLTYVSRYHLFILFYLLTLIADTISTSIFMRHLGAESEFHPLVALLSVQFGIIAGPILGAVFKAVGCFWITFTYQRFAVAIFLIASAGYLFATWYNIWGVYIL